MFSGLPIPAWTPCGLNIEQDRHFRLEATFLNDPRSDLLRLRDVDPGAPIELVALHAFQEITA